MHVRSRRTLAIVAATATVGGGMTATTVNMAAADATPPAPTQRGLLDDLLGGLLGGLLGTLGLAPTVQQATNVLNTGNAGGPLTGLQIAGLLGGTTTTQQDLALTDALTTAQLTSLLGALDPAQLTTLLGSLGADPLGNLLDGAGGTNLTALLGGLTAGQLPGALGSLTGGELTGLLGPLTGGDLTGILGGLTGGQLNGLLGGLTSGELTSILNGLGGDQLTGLLGPLSGGDLTGILNGLTSGDLTALLDPLTGDQLRSVLDGFGLADLTSLVGTLAASNPALQSLLDQLTGATAGTPLAPIVDQIVAILAPPANNNGGSNGGGTTTGGGTTPGTTTGGGTTLKPGAVTLRPGAAGTGFTGYRATLGSLKLAKSRKSAKVKVSCPASAPKGCLVRVTGKVGGKKGTATKDLLLLRNTSQTITVRLSSAAVKRLKQKGGTVQLTAKTVQSSLGASSKSARVKAPKKAKKSQG